MSRYHDDRTVASDPGGLRLSKKKVDVFRGGIGFLERQAIAPDQLLNEHLTSGDSRAAIVMQTSPDVLVAAYTDELDCVAMLQFPQFVKMFRPLDVGDHLLTVNTYTSGLMPASDLIQGPGSHRRYSNFHPLIAEFLSDDLDRIERRKQEIQPGEWERTYLLAVEYAGIQGWRFRDGNPFRSGKPAK